MNAIKVEINPFIRERLPQTYEILTNSGLMVHPDVYKVILTGSRGLAGNFREDSDVDLSLLLDKRDLKSKEEEETLFQNVLLITLSSWKSPIELDTVVVYDIGNCNLSCFDWETSKEKRCQGKGIDCFGLYKIQKGFRGYVPKIGIDIERIYPIMAVYERARKR